MMPPIVHTIVQLLSLAGLMVGLVMLAGLGWALIVGCSCVALVSVLSELGRPHPAARKDGA